MKSSTPPRDTFAPVLAALRRLIAATDKSIATAAELRAARAELARLLENEKTQEVKKNGNRKATTHTARSR